MLESLNQFFMRTFPPGTLGIIAVLLFLISVFIDISKIKFNPWKRILRDISGVFNADVIASQKELKQKMENTCNSFREKYDELAGQLDAVQVESLAWQKRVCRRRIIEFADECRRGVQHSQQMFLNVFDDITEYEKLCKSTGDPNHVVDESEKYIRETYQKRLEKNDFI